MFNPANDQVRPVSVGLADRSDRGRVEVTGPDRAKFLHNLTTNEVKRLLVGRGCEAFITSPQGKTIGYVIMLAAEGRIVVRSDPGGMELALPHFHKYGIFDDVAVVDRTTETFELHLAGDGAVGLVQRAGGQVPELSEYAHAAAEVGGCRVRVIRESPAGLPGLTLIGDRPDAATVAAALMAAGQPGGLRPLDPAEFEALRIEAGTPVFGKDITEKNLPQEIGRDSRAISFVKGCYLGQEIVARIDALGHVNQLLKGLAFEPGAPCPTEGSALEDEGKRLGTITSAAHAPARGRPFALALVRTSHARDGTRLEVAGPPGIGHLVATVSDLPFPSLA
jgi:folate-binding protein YgfZ